LGFAMNIALTRKSAIASALRYAAAAKRRWKREIVRLPTLRRRVGTAFGTARLVAFALSADDAWLFRTVRPFHHRGSRAFDRRQAAAAWLEKRETELVKPCAIEREKTPDPTLGSVIDRYTEESIKDIGRTKTQVLRAIKRYDIANRQCSTITSADIIAFANQLVSKVTPQTVGNYLSRPTRCRCARATMRPRRSAPRRRCSPSTTRASARRWRISIAGLGEADYLAGELSIADLAFYSMYKRRKALADLAPALANLRRWGERLDARPGCQRGLAA
jgi:hypothetical protein